MNSQDQPPQFKKGSRAALFFELAEPDELGFSHPIPVTKFVGKYEKLRFGNGGSWIRPSTKLAQSYNIRRHPEGRGKITHVELQGYRKVPVTKKPIPNIIQQKITAQPCVVLGTSSPECDHKDGRLDDPRLSDVNQLRLDDFQPLSKAANVAKRQHCVECRKTGKTV